MNHFALVARTDSGLCSGKIPIIRLQDPDFMASEEITNARIAQGIMDGDREFESVLVERFSKGVELMLRRRTRDYALAQDLTQDTLIAVIKRLRETGIDNPHLLNAYVHQTARYIVLAWQRRAGNYREIAIQDPDCVSDVDGPEAAMNRDIAAEQVRRLISELRTQRDRDVLRRYYFHEQTKAQVCDALGLAPGAFDRIISRARARFRQILEERYVH